MLPSILIGVLTISVGYSTLHISGQSAIDYPVVDSQTRRHLEQTARNFVEAYRRRRDFKDCFQPFFVRDAVERMKRARFFQSMDMEPALIQEATTGELARAYVAVMNFHFASLAYEFNYPKAPVPRELTGHKEDYRYILNVIDDSQASTAVLTKSDLARFTAEFERAAGVYRRLLPRHAFKSSNYRRRIAENRSANQLDKLDGLPDFGVPEGTAVFALSMDMFDFYFINDHGQYRVVTLGLE